MKLHYKINLTSLGILITVAFALAIEGVVAINHVTYDLNRKLMIKEVENLVANIRAADQVLKQSGVAGVENYRQRAKRDLLAEFKKYEFGRTGRLMVIRQDGVVLLNQLNRQPVDRDLLQKMVGMGEGSLSNVSHGESRFYCFKRFPDWNWLIVLSIKTGEMLEVRNEFLINAAFILLVSLTLGSLFLLWSTNRIVGPIRQLAAAADAISHGEWKTSLPVSQGKDEISKLTNSFKQMSDNLAATYRDLSRNLVRTKQSQDELSAQKERLAVTLRSIGDGVISTDVKGHITLINTVAEQMTGWRQEDALDQPVESVFQIITQQGRVRSGNPILKIIKSGGTEGFSGQTVLVARDGSERIISASGAPIFDGTGRALGVILVFRDITERVEMQDELTKAHKLESVGILAGGIAHDFNNILTAILGNISLAKIYAKDEERIYKKLEETERASLRAKNLTKQLLTFSRGGEPIKKIISASEVIRDSALFALTGSNCRCDFNLAASLWSIEADEGQISQVIHNLIINADQAMPHGGGIQVHAENMTLVDKNPFLLEPGRYIHISVIDSGQGISPEDLAMVFDPYYTTKEKGSGLGLTSAYSIVKKHNGHITVDSMQGFGSSFQIYLPATEKEADVAENQPEDLIMGTGRVLVMDDERIVRDVTGLMLNTLGYEVEFARNGEEAIRMYKAANVFDKSFDVVIMDLTVPGGMGGREAMEKLLDVDPGVVAIVASGYANNPIMGNYREYGFSAVISKPFKIDCLARTLHEVLSQRRFE
jgi:PAS domain S-box-containing protein